MNNQTFSRFGRYSDETPGQPHTVNIKASDVKRGDSVLANFRWRKVSTVWIKGDLACITFGRSGSVELPADKMLNVRQATYA